MNSDIELSEGCQNRRNYNYNRRTQTSIDSSSAANGSQRPVRKAKSENLAGQSSSRGGGMPQSGVSKVSRSECKIVDTNRHRVWESGSGFLMMTMCL